MCEPQGEIDLRVEVMAQLTIAIAGCRKGDAQTIHATRAVIHHAVDHASGEVLARLARVIFMQAKEEAQALLKERQ